MMEFLFKFLMPLDDILHSKNLFSIHLLYPILLNGIDKDVFGFISIRNEVILINTK